MSQVVNELRNTLALWSLIYVNRQTDSRTRQESTPEFTRDA